MERMHPQGALSSSTPQSLDARIRQQAATQTWEMHMKSLWALAIALTGGAILWAIYNPFFATPPRRLIIAKDVTFSHAKAGQSLVTGHFELTEPSPLALTSYLQAI